MSIEDEQDDRPRRDFTELLPIFFAMVLTAAAIGLIFFKFSAGAPGDAPPAAQPSEITIGIGQGQTIHPPARPATVPPPASQQP